MALTLSRVDRTPRNYVLAAIMETVPGGVESVGVALLPPRGAPTAATVWTSVTYASGSFDLVLAGPDADSTGALVVPASADLWMKVTDAPLVEAVKVERVTVLGGGPNLPSAPLYVGSVNGQTGAVTLDADDVGAIGVGVGAGGALSGEYPNPGLNTTAVVQVIEGADDVAPTGAWDFDQTPTVNGVPVGSGGGGGLEESEVRSIATAESRRGLLPPASVGIVLARGTSGLWDAGVVEGPVVRWDPKVQRLAMTYVGYDNPNVHAQVGLAWSDDGGLTWTKDAANPVLTHSGVPGSVDENGATGPVWFYDADEDLYYLWYIGLTGTGYEQGTKRLCYATAPALTGPWTRQGAVISPSGTGWRGTSIYHADPIERDGVKYLFFNAKGADGKEYIGYATSSSGTWAGPWTVDDVNSPLVSPGASGAWDDNKVGDPSVYRVGDIWYMAYYGYRLTTDIASDGVAWTTDAMFPLGPTGGAWTKFTGNPILVPGNIAGDTKYAAKPFIRRTARRLSHYYSALSTGGAREIALAIDPDDREVVAVGISEYTTPITTSSTAYSGITPSSWLMNFTGRAKPQVRFHARVSAATTTVTLRDHNYQSAFATVVGNVGFQVVTSAWGDIPNGSGALTSYCEWKTTAAVSVSITNLVWEFRWVNS